jgi:hypothetical protein
MLNMQRPRSNRFIAGALKDSDGRTQGLDEGQLRRMAPSIFAEGKHGSRSERYAYIPTIEAVRGLMGEGFVPVAAKQGRSRVEGKAEFTKHLVRFRHPTQAMADVGDVTPEIILINSHDGTSSYWIMAGAFRGICYNGLYSADLVDDFKVGHTGNIVEKVIEGTWSVVDQVHKVTDKAQEWKEIVLTPDEQGVFAEAVSELRFDAESGAALEINPRRLLRSRRPEDDGADLWRTFNRAQENAVKGGIDYTVSVTQPDNTQRPRHLQTRPVASVDGETKLNRALWVLAQGMQNLKQAA